jgi:hypothetical protein
MAEACRVLGITFAEFVRFATLQSLDEFEAGTQIRPASAGDWRTWVHPSMTPGERAQENERERETPGGAC